MKRSKPLSRRTAPIRRAPVRKVNPKRKARNLLRAYGPAARREWMTSMDCLTCGQPSFESARTQQSHLRSRSGAGRKGDARHTVPACDYCHKLYPRQSEWAKRFPDFTDAVLNAYAAALELEWQAHLNRGTEP